jgi:hypothetical protein
MTSHAKATPTKSGIVVIIAVRFAFGVENVLLKNTLGYLLHCM